MCNRLDRNHGIHSRSARECGAVHHVEIADLPSLALGISRGSPGRAAHAHAAHDMERKQRELSGIPASGIHVLSKLSERASAPGLIRAPLGVRRKDQFRPGSFQNARRANKAMTKVLTIKCGERVMRNRVTLTIQGHAAAVAIPQERSDAYSVRKLLQQRTVVFRLAPRENGSLNCGLQRSGLELHAVIAAQETELIGINGLHGAFPRANFFPENAGYIGDGVKMQVAADMFVAQAGAQQQRWSVNGAASGDYGRTAHADVLATACASVHANGAACFQANGLGARLNKKPRACILRVGKPRFHRGPFCSDGATESAVAADFALLAADDVARHRCAMPAQRLKAAL